MKAVFPRTAFFLLALAVLPASGVDLSSMRDQTTPAELEKSRAAGNPYQSVTSLAAADPAALPEARDQQADLLARSVFLNDGANNTILPTGAVLVMADECKAKAVASPTLAQAPWSVFSGRNRAWIRELELSTDEIAGRRPLGANRIRSIAVKGCLVVATYQGQPVAPAPAVAAEFKSALASK